MGENSRSDDRSRSVSGLDLDDASNSWFEEMLKPIAIARTPTVERSKVVNLDTFKGGQPFFQAAIAKTIATTKTKGPMKLRNDSSNTVAQCETNTTTTERQRTVEAHMRDFEERYSIAPPELPLSGVVGTHIVINSLSGSLCKCIIGNSLSETDVAARAWDVLHDVKQAITDATGIPACEQRLIISPSWEEATLIRIETPALHILSEEAVFAHIDCQGALAASSSVFGRLVLAAWDESIADSFRLVVSKPSETCKVKVHPMMNKNDFHASNILRCRRSSNTFSSRPTSIIKWKRDIHDIPFRLSFHMKNGFGQYEFCIHSAPSEFKQFRIRFLDADQNEISLVEAPSAVVGVVSNWQDDQRALEWEFPPSHGEKQIVS